MLSVLTTKVITVALFGLTSVDNYRNEYPTDKACHQALVNIFNTTASSDKVSVRRDEAFTAVKIADENDHTITLYRCENA